MKTAVSIPDQIYKSAEQLAARQGTTRSHLYAQAVQSYVQQHNDTHVTQQLNKVYSDHSDDFTVDPVLKKAQQQSIGKEAW